jgi:indole-3-glycerol phosphate synthase
LEEGASGVILMSSIVGSDLRPLLDSCTIMGTEAIVEVHTPNELEFAISCGATLFLLSARDRHTGIIYPDQVSFIIMIFCIGDWF